MDALDALWLWEKKKGFPIGTVRKWKGGDVIKTDKGWEPYTGQTTPAPKPAEPPPAPAKAQEPAPAPAPVTVPPAAAPLPGSRKANNFKPADAAKALGDFLSNPNDIDAQAGVRGALRTLCSDFGMTNRDGPKSLFNKFTTFDESKQKSFADGVHTWDGVITVRPKHAKRSQLFLSGASDEKVPKFKQATSFHVLVHEAIHGHSPIRQEQFKGRYRLLEEATTELAARKVMVDGFGISWAQANEKGAYSEFVKALGLGTKTALKRKGVSVPEGEAWADSLGEAAIEMRRRPPPHDPDKYAYLNRFAASLPIKGADTPEVKKEIAEAVWLALKPARETEKVYKAKALMGALLGSPQFQAMPPEAQQKAKQLVEQEHTKAVAGLEKAIKKWMDYVNGVGSAADSADEALDSVLSALMEAAPMKPVLADDTDMLPRNDLPLAIEYAKALAADGKLDAWTVQDLAMLQDDVLGAAKALSQALSQAGISFPQD